MGGLTFLVGKNQPPLFSSNAKKNRSSNGVVVKAYSTLDAAQAVLGCILQGSQHSFHRTAQMKLEAVILYPGGNTGIVRKELNSVAIHGFPGTGQGPVTVTEDAAVSEGDQTVRAENRHRQQSNMGRSAPPTPVFARDVDYAVYGKAIFLSAQNGKEQSVPKWVDYTFSQALNELTLRNYAKRF